MTATCSLKSNENSVNALNSNTQASLITSSDSIAALLQSSLDAASSLDTQNESTPEELNLIGPNAPTNSTPNNNPGLSDIFSFQGMISTLVSVVAESLSEQAQQQNTLGQAILAKMQEEVAKIKEEERKEKHHSFFHLIVDIFEVLAACTGIGLAIESLVAGAKALADHKSFGDEFKSFWVDKLTSIAENPSLAPVLKVLTIVTAVVMVAVAGLTDGATMAVVLILLMIATQIPLHDGKTGIQLLAVGTAKLLEDLGVHKDVANMIGDCFALAVGIAAAVVTGQASESISMGLMVFGSILGSLSSNIGEDAVALSDLKGKAAMELQYGLTIGLSLIAILSAMAGGLTVADEASEEATNGLSKLVQKINDSMEGNWFSQKAESLNNTISNLIPDQLSQLGEKYTNEILIGATKLTGILQIVDGSLTITQNVGDILIALVSEAIAKLQAGLTELSAQNGQVQDNIQNIEENLSNTLAALEAQLSNSQEIPLGLTSFAI